MRYIHTPGWSSHTYTYLLTTLIYLEDKDHKPLIEILFKKKCIYMFSFFNSLQKNSLLKISPKPLFRHFSTSRATNPLQDDVDAMSIFLTRLPLLPAVSTLGDSWETR